MTEPAPTSILLVDDEPLILEILTEFFRTNSDTAVRSVSGGKKALDEILANKEVSTPRTKAYG